uniref:Non-specific serine/threonine protein kinase n=1 Tax=Lactuca sativa TaxID=4236 RepID=A0A9R1XVY9_LACSA|nr:hypothetical protein LSAT_V11C200051340 [Lactuca sativa]
MVQDSVVDSFNQLSQTAGGGGIAGETIKTSLHYVEPSKACNMDPVAQTLNNGRYPCGHEEVVGLNKGIHIYKESLKIEPDQENPGKYLVEFTYDAYGAGSITLRFVSKTEVYLLAIQARTSPCISEDGSTNGGTTMSQLTIAVFDKEQYRYKVRVTDQTLWVNGAKYVLHDKEGFGNSDGADLNWNDLGKKCLICLSKFQDTSTLHREGRKIGKLLVYDKKIGKGSNETIVYEGIYGDKSVAVKKIVKVHHDVALKVIKIRVYPINILILLGCMVWSTIKILCICSLHDLILSHGNLSAESQPTVKVFKDLELSKPSRYPPPILLTFMRDIVEGLGYLHGLRINHGDLKPQNVLIHNDTSSCGSGRWQAPEQLRNEEPTPAADLFNFGCLLFFCITGGQHPFGDIIDDRDNNILHDMKNLSLVENIPEAFDLISRLLHPDPESRPKAGEVYNHPLFWDPQTRISFLLTASQKVKRRKPNEGETNSNLIASLDRRAPHVFSGEWNTKLDVTLRNDVHLHIKKYYYNYKSVCHLIRLIRNKHNHYLDSPDLKTALGSLPTGFDAYFRRKFPKLLIEAYKFFKEYCGFEDLFINYYRHKVFR